MSMDEGGRWKASWHGDNGIRGRGTFLRCFNLPTFDRAIQQLNDAECGTGRWSIGVGAFMFNSKVRSQYAVVTRVLDRRGDPIAINLDPDFVTENLLATFLEI
jgi:hypothetical protein